jgi:peptidoglycan hydrolase CwlO-like protein
LSEQDFTQIKTWLDLAVKAIIGIVISIVGMDYRAVKNSLHELEESKYRVTSEVQIIQAELNHIKNQIDRIDKKLDKVLDK